MNEDDEGDEVMDAAAIFLVIVGSLGIVAHLLGYI